jgi:hypothetical protein
MQHVSDTTPSWVVTFGTPLALLKCRKAVARKIQRTRSNPMKVKTNMKAGSALWGS